MKVTKKFIAAFLAAVMMISAFGCSQTTTSESVDSGTTTSAVQESTPVPADSSSPDLPTGTTAITRSEPVDIESDVETVVEKSLSVSCTVANTWQESGMECSQIDVVIINDTDIDTDSWNFTLDIGQDAEIMQSWNVSITSAGNCISVSNVDYNGVIPGCGETTFGFIAKTSNAVTSISVKGDVASVPTQQKPSTTTISTSALTPAEPQKPNIESVNGGGLVSVHGQLSVKGTDLVDKNGEPVQLRGVSTHGIQWFPSFANKEVFRYLRDEWKINVIRLAMYTGAGEGYTDATKAGIEQTVQNAVDAAIELDMYVIVDWHVLQDQSPQVRKADSLRFFDYMSEKYADYPNIIYEICNEPNGYAYWSGDVKPYAEEVIPVIRANDPDSVIVIGTPTWSQDIDKAMADPLDYDNVMYALHYYAATHTDWLRDRLKNCYNSGLPIMVTEFGNCDASGNGHNDFDQGRRWLELLDSLNISYMNWSLCDKAEAASLLKPGASPTGNWSDNNLTENGKFMRDWFVNHS